MVLADIAIYVTDKISSENITLEEYVTTDSLLQNKRGRCNAQNLPPIACNLTHFREGDILVANIRPYLKKIWLADSEGGCSADVLVFRAKEGHSSEYLHAVLLQDAFFSYAMKGAKGSKMPRGDKDQIMRFPIHQVSPSDEPRIGNIIHSLNKKIELNAALNHYLEAMAKQLYDYWFVQFDFPDENGKPYKSSGGKMVWNEKLKREIPQGWELIPLFKGVDVQYGFPFSTDLFTETPTEIPIVRIRDIIDGSTSAFYCGEVEDKYRLNKGDIVIGMDGNFHMNYWHSDEDFLNQRCVRLRPRGDSQISALQSLFETKPYIKAKEKNAKGSTVGHLSDKDLKDMWLMKPMSNGYFNPRAIFDSLMNKMIEHKEELLQLTKCRNELLPLLMNGQLSVKQLNNDLPVD